MIKPYPMIRSLFLSMFFFLYSISLSAQYDDGYIVTKNGENKVGLIKNQNWIKNPESIYFKGNSNDGEQKIEVTDLSEFGIGNTIKFIVAEVDVDISSESISKLTNTKNPIFEKRSIALRKLIDGYISLYEYQFSNGIRYYIKKPNENLEPLVFKKYLASSNQIATNEYYKQQLSLLFSDKADEYAKALEQLTYSRKSIARLVNEYNLLNNENSISYVENVKKKTKFTISVFGGIEQTSVNYQFRNVATLNPSFENISQSLFGAELELRALNDRLGIFSGYSIKSKVSESVELQTSVADITQTSTLSYNHNTFFIGARGYIPTFKNVNIRISAGLNFDSVSDFAITFEISQINENNSRRGASEFIGIGLEYKKLFVETRFFKSSMFVENVSNGTSVDNSNVNFRIGYHLW